MLTNIIDVSYQVYANYCSADLDLKIVWSLCFSFATLWILLVAIIVINKLIRNEANKRTANTTAKIEQKIYKHLFDSEQLDQLFPVPLLLNRKEKEIAINVLVALKKRLSGDFADAIEKIYRYLNLEKVSIKRAYSSKYHIAAKGIQELTIMKCISAITIARLRMNATNLVLRREALYSLIKMEGFKGLTELKTLELPISRWQMITIINALKEEEKPEILNLNDCINLKNEDVILLLLKIVIQFDYYASGNELIHFKGSPNDEIREQIAIMIGKFGMSQHSKLLLSWLLIEENESVKKELVKAMELLLKESDIPQLLQIFNDVSFDVKMQVGKLLFPHREKIKGDDKTPTLVPIFSRLEDELTLYSS